MSCFWAYCFPSHNRIGTAVSAEVPGKTNADEVSPSGPGRRTQPNNVPTVTTVTDIHHIITSHKCSPALFASERHQSPEPQTCATGRAPFVDSWSLVPEKPVPPICSGMMSESASWTPVTGWRMSFLMSFSTHSMVTTSPLEWVGRLVLVSE